MKLGNFSVSLALKELETSRAFYEKLGFKVFAGEMDKNYLILKSDSAVIGLFQEMFEGNILTFTPDWDENAQNVEGIDDIRVIQKKLIADGVQIDNPVNEKSSGAASLMLKDPDGNVILLDQHV